MIITGEFPDELHSHLLALRPRWELSSVFSHSTHERGVVERSVRSSQSALLSREEQNPIRDFVLRSIKPRLEMALMLPLGELTPVHLIRYREGDFFSAHRDRGGPNAKAAYTVVGSVNQPMSGGELIIHEPEKLEIPVAARQYVAFPSAALHEGAEILVGTKEIFVCWINDN